MKGSLSARRVVVESGAVFLAAMGVLCALTPTAPFARELGVCEAGAVRDVLAGNLVLPHFIPGPMVHVPPLYWWTAALAVKAFGWSEIALRLPSMVAAALTCAVIFAWMRVRIGRSAALWAVAALLCEHFFLDAARQPRMDAMLALFVTAAAVLLEGAVNGDATDGSGGAPAGNRRVYLAVAALTIGLGILTKGILGIVLPGATIASYLVVRRRLLDLFRIDLILAFAGGLAIGLAWYVAAYAVGGRKFLDWQLTMNLWSRFVPAEAGGAGYCVHPVWYFAPQVVAGSVPWSLYLPAVAIAAWPRRESALQESVTYTLCWFAAIFLFFSSSHGKCLIYILPAFPPLAALTGWAVSEARETRPQRLTIERAIGVGSATIAAGVLVAGAILAGLLTFGAPGAIAAWLHPTDRRYLDIFMELQSRRAPMLLVWMLASGAGAIAALAGIRRRAITVQLLAVLAIAASGSLFWFGAMNPALAERETLEGFAREVAQTVPAEARIGHIGIEDCDLYFYSSRPIEPVFRFNCGAETRFPRYIVIRQPRFDELAPAARLCLKPLLQSAAVDSAGPRLLVEQMLPAQ